MTRNLGAILALGLVLLAANAAHAQTGPALVLTPWPDGVQSQHNPSAQGWNTHSKGADEDVDFFRFRDSGRYRFDPSDDRSMAVGYDVFALGIRSDDAALPSRLVDVAVGTGFLLHEDDDWTITLPIAVGTASNRPVRDSRGWYGKASIVGMRQLDERSQLIVSLGYDGNRTFLPDLPLPGVSYIYHYDDTLSLTLGVPFAGFDWQPNDHWEVTFRYFLVTEFAAEVQHHLTEDWSLFASIDSERHAFHRDGDSRKRRLFFRQRRAELGARWQMNDDIELLGAGGYSFGARLERGYDVRDLDTVRDFGDAPYVRVGLSASF